ncbi:hypothetical protein AVEN_77105-1 [Araneus ventricosus]|uniref:Uncharacterized protein n=1 Tax=Araneus ventricosus TaxID=182803 RepID=A0A4Y2GGZ5_ARAVE|nr:hypothetical protein AVEN_77105-1 [Araneus ventricosus]
MSGPAAAVVVSDSLDLAPSDYHLFQHLKRFLARQHFPSDELQIDGCQRLSPLSGAGFLRHRYTEIDTSFKSGGSYVEGYLKECCFNKFQ